MRCIVKTKNSFFFLVFFCISITIACDNKRDHDLVFYDFESESVLDEINWKCHTLFSISNMYAAHGKKSLKTELFPSSYPGLSPYLKHHDWRGYKTLSFDVYNPSSEIVKLVLRIDDKEKSLEYSDRYNKSFMIMPGANTLEIPLVSLKTSNTNRSLELKNIYRFLVFMSHPDKRHVLYFDYFRLIVI
jgi:hypothetical protein